MKAILLLILLAGCSTNKNSDPKCMNGYLVSTREFGMGFCESVGQNGAGGWAHNCHGFQTFTNKFPADMILNGNVLYGETHCYNTESE